MVAENWRVKKEGKELFGGMVGMADKRWNSCWNLFVILPAIGGGGQFQIPLIKKATDSSTDSFFPCMVIFSG